MQNHSQNVRHSFDRRSQEHLQLLSDAGASTSGRRDSGGDKWNDGGCDGLCDGGDSIRLSTSLVAGLQYVDYIPLPRKIQLDSIGAHH